MSRHDTSPVVPPEHIESALAEAPLQQRIAPAESRSAANEEEPAVAAPPAWPINPLWAINVGMGVFFLAVGALLAIG